MTALQGQSGAGMVAMHIGKPRPRQRKSADMNGKRITRGCIVSWHGLRYVVNSTVGAELYAHPLNVAGRPDKLVHTFLLCSTVQVVTP